MGAAPPSGVADGLFSRRSPLRRTVRVLGAIFILCLGILFAGFLRFADSVVSLAPPTTPRADAIVVLTGGYQRIDQAVNLLISGAGERLLISGVNPGTSAARLSKLTRSSSALFSCCVDMGYQALDTIGNAAETARWISDHGYRSVLVVTNNYHMPRSLLELRRADPDTDFIAYPVVNSDLKVKNWFIDPDALRTLLSEYAKVTVATVRDLIGLRSSPGLRDPLATGGITGASSL
ncbi:YdcF family protein [Rhizobiaceae bacterium BDR2-2]|uniref:YdcF family protein n=1 Tax=Ectorhizobium quercum TaxID=2965071 RepID=A0AAE3N264_9HYPH|nr:YdcF family protein [Ectorhizobium quercum]MCX8999184.1 YdcF family protein [Ectorhizobium quercum]